MGATTIMNYDLDMIQNDFTQVVPSEIGIKEPFKQEGNVLYIPPHTYLRNELQYRAAKHGFESGSAKKYAKNFLKFSKMQIPKRQRDIAKPIFGILDGERSVSDSILRFAGRRGWETGQPLGKDVAGKIALWASNVSVKRLRKTEKVLERYF